MDSADLKTLKTVGLIALALASVVALLYIAAENNWVTWFN